MSQKDHHISEQVVFSWVVEHTWTSVTVELMSRPSLIYTVDATVSYHHVYQHRLKSPSCSRSKVLVGYYRNMSFSLFYVD